MDLELRNVQVKDVVPGDKNDLKDGVLTVEAAAALGVGSREYELVEL